MGVCVPCVGVSVFSEKGVVYSCSCYSFYGNLTDF